MNIEFKNYPPFYLLDKVVLNKNEYMYMGTILQNGIEIHLFKNIITRHYVNIDNNCNRYMFLLHGRYIKISV